MRLTCPNCGAQYEVPEDVIPPEGRDVQCSNCSSTWFQAHRDFDADAEANLDVPAPDAEWTPEVDDASAFEADEEKAIEAPVETDAVTMTADATDEALAAAVKAAVRRARPDHIQQAPVEDEEIEEAPEAEPGKADDFESELGAALEEDHSETPEPEYDDEPELEDPEDAEEAPQRRELDPSVADVLREEAALEAARRAEETSLETQTDLGLDEPVDDAAKRARQARERMARMRGVSADEMDAPQEPVPANSRRELLPDIEEINSTLRSTEDRPADEQPDGRPTVSQRRAGGSRIGFALAILLIAGGIYVYSKPDQVSQSIPQSERYVAAYVNAVDNGRLKLDAQMTKLMLWLDGMASDSADS